MDNSKFRGTGVAMITPFKNGAIDFYALEKLINHQISSGVDYLVSLGTTGEAITQSEEECRKVFDFTIKMVNKRVPLVAGMFGGNNTAALKKRIANYNFEGFDAILSSSPAYNKPSQGGIFQHYMNIVEASSLPIIIYNVPGRTASNITADTILQLARANEKFIAVKEASGDIIQGTKIIREKPRDFLVLSGDDPTCFALCAAGGDGVISVIGNAYPKEWAEMIKNIFDGKIDKAKAINLKFEHLHKWLYVEGNPVGVKALMKYKSRCTEEVRLPLISLSKENFNELIKAVELIEHNSLDHGVRR